MKKKVLKIIRFILNNILTERFIHRVNRMVDVQKELAKVNHKASIMGHVQTDSRHRWNQKIVDLVNEYNELKFWFEKPHLIKCKINPSGKLVLRYEPTKRKASK